MRVVHQAGDFEESLAAARREAGNAFADERVILERFVESPRHIEVQVFGDRHGNHVHLFERDCSAQRRYQKIVELAPALNYDAESGVATTLPADIRERLTTAALNAARAVNYTGAGTVEFLLGESGEVWFMEMNTRLQVEHPVTEMVTGLDLVEWQLRVAAGEPLPLPQQQIACRGYAIEVRIYAEDPSAGFLPSCGALNAIHWPELEHVRIETGVAEGDEISTHYDPMIAKLVAWSDRPEDLFKHVLKALSHTAVFGPATNIGFLQLLLNDTADRCGVIDTTYVDQHLQTLMFAMEPDARTLLPSVVRQLQIQEETSSVTAGSSDDRHSPWARLDGWRPLGSAARVVQFGRGENQWRFEAHGDGTVYRIGSEQQSWIVIGRPPQIEVDGQPQSVRVYQLGNQFQQVTSENRIQLTLMDPHGGDAATEEEQHDLLAPMPGRIIAIAVALGDHVTRGQPLVIMEAMKMELTIRAPRDAIIAALPHQQGEFIEADTLLVHFEEEAA
jgi:3-methylcrotonyl-CoA carboxylase alpha subunit